MQTKSILTAHRAH